MQFKHPELLYALLLLLIPILIHLFQLRRFQKVAFTNVAFLRKVTLQTRKSSQLKKWLTLLMRMLAIACIVLAFAQPFTASKTALNTEKETVIYLDNSFSSQLKGANGPLLERAKQQLFEQLGGEHKISWFTNTEAKRNVTQTAFKKEILSVGYAYKQLSLSEVFLKAGQLFSKSKSAEKRLILLTDFQQKGVLPKGDNDFTISAVPFIPVTTNTVSIDSAYVVNSTTTATQLKVLVSGQGTLPANLPISLYNRNSLIAKTAINFEASSQASITFDIDNPEGFKGLLQLTDANLPYDNSLYFSINTPKDIKVMSINDGGTQFLQRLYNRSGYTYTQQPSNAINYNEIPAQNLIVLNELKNIPTALSNSLKAFSDGGGSIVVLPSKNADLISYNQLLNNVGIGTLQGLIQQEKKVAKINFSHPLYQNVFEKQVVNFQFPKVQTYYGVRANATPVLRFEDGKPFLLQSNKTFLFTASIHASESNFKNSPLIVPTFINVAQQSLSLPNLYYEIGKLNRFAVPTKLTQDEIVTFKDSLQSFIPLQQTKANSVLITTEEEPSRAGTFQVEKEEIPLEMVSYNYARDESQLIYTNPDDIEGISVFDSVSELFETMASENKINSFWKWFVIFALIFLLLEMLILKFFKH
ncbi:MAG: BatA domain-containing protein [Bacteroidetes bacterium]|nr:BatA domain-containing protein [Bacteroidota bacterium]